MAFATTAGAVVIGTSEILGCDGVGSVCTVSGATITAAGGNLQAKAGGTPSTVGLGVNVGTNGEIDINPSESITIAFDWAQIVNSFRIVFFYNGPEFFDVLEAGTVTVSYADGSSSIFTFASTLVDNVLTWDGFGAITNCGAQVLTGSGCFDFTGDPLGSALVTSIAFNAILGSTINGGTNQSDYAFGGLVATPVPGALLLLLTGIGGLSFASRGRRKIAATL